MTQMKHSMAFVTTGSVDEARKIAAYLVENELAACCNIVPAIESVYTWKGRVENDAETLMIIKTRKSLAKKVVDVVRKLHSYDVPEVIFFDIENGSKDYLKWITDVTSGR